MPGAGDPLTALRRRDGDRELRPHERPVAEDLDLLDVARSLEVGYSLRPLRLLQARVACLAHRRLSRRQEHDVIRDQCEQRIEVAALRGRGPRRDELAY